MNIKITTTMKSITVATLLSIFMIIFGAIEAGAMSFQTFTEVDTPQACGAYDAVFYDGQCVKPNDGSDGEVLGALDKKSVSVDLIDTRCVAEDGVVELALEHVQLYELKNKSNGDVVSQGGTGANFQTFSGLSDGNYKYTGRGNHGNDSASFTIDCDPKGVMNPRVAVSCTVTPANPKVGDEVRWEADASQGDGDYTYSWSGDVTGNDSNVSVTYSDEGQKDGYVTARSDGTQDTARCSVNVSTESDNGGNGGGSDNGGNGGSDDNSDKDAGTDGDTDEDSPTFSRTIEEF